MSTKALVYAGKGKIAIQEVPRPRLRDDYVIVKTTAVGLNPTDWKGVARAVDTDVGRRIGCDYAGVVEEVGSKVRKIFKKGDRISGIAYGNDSLEFENGTFANWIAVKGDLQIKTPDNLTDVEAATHGVAVVTVGQGLYRDLGLPLPGEATSSDQYLLIHGGSTATGIWGIQFAKLSGLKVIATSSPHNFDYLKSLGAEKIYDYKDPATGSNIRAYTNNTLKLAWDCAGGGEVLVASALSSDGGKYSSIQLNDKSKVEAVNDKVDGPHLTLAYEATGENFRLGTNDSPPKPEEFEYASKFTEIARGLLVDGKLKVPRIILNDGGSGLEGVIKGLDDLKAGKVSGGKMIYTL
ncbi:hypothetical protein FANTH_7761 [Fusarium anthophilum]|uniref:Enoyl reductase (ER) domain-containing protein n=1 Tax=Fusarium anthophilum TaxID=48485 RepID=A0A8H4ZCM5_9HYPO|nr:hypothetical protein FANTH_7761 [Fusarium anthophilum]